MRSVGHAADLALRARALPIARQDVSSVRRTLSTRYEAQTRTRVAGLGRSPGNQHLAVSLAANSGPARKPRLNPGEITAVGATHR